jgi:hypothetical protein
LKEKSLYYFHKKLKILKNPKNPLLVFFLGGFFWVFLGGFLMPTLLSGQQYSLHILPNRAPFSIADPSIADPTFSIVIFCPIHKFC